MPNLTLTFTLANFSFVILVFIFIPVPRPTQVCESRVNILQRIDVNVSFFLTFSISISATCGYCV